MSTPPEVSSRRAPIALNTSGFAGVLDGNTSEPDSVYEDAHTEGHMLTWDPVAAARKAAASAELGEDTVERGGVVHYEERDDAQETHGMRFRRDTVVSFGRHEAFRVNRHGVPVFTPGWTASRSTVRSWQRTVLLGVAAACAFIACMVMVQNQFGTDRNYHRIMETGIHAEATVAEVTEGKNPAGLMSDIYEMSWAGEGQTGTFTIDTTTSPFVEENKYQVGDSFAVVVDSQDTDRWLLPQDKPLLGKVNVINVLPGLAGGALATASLFSAWMSIRLTDLAIRTRRDERQASQGTNEAERDHAGVDAQGPEALAA